MIRPFLVPLALLLHATPLVGQEEPSAIFIERVDVNVVNVEVFVTGKDGSRIAGLERDDFEVLEDGRPVEISSFSATVRPDLIDRDFERDRALITGSPEATAPPLPEDQQLNLAVYVDHHNLRPGNRQRVLEELEGFVEDRILQGDRVMLAGYQRALEVVQPFTSDRDRLRAGIRAMGEVSARGPINDAELRRTLREMSNAAAVGEPTTTAHQHLRSYVNRTVSELRRSAEALRNMVRTLAGLPGRKALLYVSDGLPQRPGEELYQHLQDLFGAQALRTLAEDVEFIDPSIEAQLEDQSHLFDAITREANVHKVTFYNPRRPGQRRRSGDFRRGQRDPGRDLRPRRLRQPAHRQPPGAADRSRRHHRRLGNPSTPSTSTMPWSAAPPSRRRSFAAVSTAPPSTFRPRPCGSSTWTTVSVSATFSTGTARSGRSFSRGSAPRSRSPTPAPVRRSLTAWSVSPAPTGRRCCGAPAPAW